MPRSASVDPHSAHAPTTNGRFMEDAPPCAREGGRQRVMALLWPHLRCNVQPALHRLADDVVICIAWTTLQWQLSQVQIFRVRGDHLLRTYPQSRGFAQKSCSCIDYMSARWRGQISGLILRTYVMNGSCLRIQSNPLTIHPRLELI